MRRAWLLNDLFVDSAARGQGVGERLLDAAAAHGRAGGAAWLMLQTAHDNLPAQRLYARAGWHLDQHFQSYILDLFRKCALTRVPGLSQVPVNALSRVYRATGGEGRYTAQPFTGLGLPQTPVLDGLGSQRKLARAYSQAQSPAGWPLMVTVTWPCGQSFSSQPGSLTSMRVSPRSKA